MFDSKETRDKMKLGRGGMGKFKRAAEDGSHGDTPPWRHAPPTHLQVLRNSKTKGRAWNGLAEVVEGAFGEP